MRGGKFKACEKSGVGADVLVVVEAADGAVAPYASYGLYPEEDVVDADVDVVLLVVVVADGAAASYES
jgi:hypothetical protein